MKKAIIAIIFLITLFSIRPAFAKNAFTEVPQGHWAYDAVRQLAARGIVTGYGKDDFNGKRYLTRYEMASITARAVEKFDQEHSTPEDFELLKRLVTEYRDEFSMLGVKVSKLDRRIAKIRENTDGWRISGRLTLDATFASQGYNPDNAKRSEIRKENMDLRISKRIDKNTTFVGNYRSGAYASADGDLEGRGDETQGQWNLFYVERRLGKGASFRVGRFYTGWESEAGLVNDSYPLYGGYRTDGFRINKAWSKLKLAALVGRNSNRDSTMAYSTSSMVDDDKTGYYMNYAVNASYQITDKWFLGASAYWFDGDSEVYEDGGTPQDVRTMGVYSGIDIIPGISLKGVYYNQQRGTPSDGQRIYSEYNDNSNAWKVILDIKQRALKFTSLWLEYSEQDNLFRTAKHYYRDYSTNPTIFDNKPRNREKTKVVYLTADQKWNDYWTTYFIFANADYGTVGYDDANNFSIGVKYQYTPAIAFLLQYDLTDFGNSTAEAVKDNNVTDHVLLFRTMVNF